LSQSSIKDFADRHSGSVSDNVKTAAGTLRVRSVPQLSSRRKLCRRRLNSLSCLC